MKKTTLVATILVASQVAFSADWSFYGSGRFTTFRNTWTGDGSEAMDNTNDIGVQSNSRFGAKANDTARKVSGVVEVGYGDGNAIVSRRLFGVWKPTSEMSVLVGKEWSLINFNHSNQAWKQDNLMYGQGAFSESRVDQLRFTAYGASVAVVKASNPALTFSATYQKGTKDTTVKIAYAAAADNPPKVEVAYAKSIGPVDIALGGGWNSYTVVTSAPKGNAEGLYDIDAFAVGGELGLKIEPAKAKVYAVFGVSQNPKEYGLKVATPALCGVHIDKAGEVQNDLALIGNFVATGTYGRYTPEVGLGMEHHANHDATGLILAGYAQLGIAFVKGVSFVPETGMVMSSTDDGTTSTDLPTLVYFGAKSQIDF